MSKIFHRNVFTVCYGTSLPVQLFMNGKSGKETDTPPARIRRYSGINKPRKQLSGRNEKLEICHFRRKVDETVNPDVYLNTWSRQTLPVLPRPSTHLGKIAEWQFLDRSNPFAKSVLIRPVDSVWHSTASHILFTKPFTPGRSLLLFEKWFAWRQCSAWLNFAFFHWKVNHLKWKSRAILWTLRSSSCGCDTPN